MTPLFYCLLSRNVISAKGRNLNNNAELPRKLIIKSSRSSRRFPQINYAKFRRKIRGNATAQIHAKVCHLLSCIAPEMPQRRQGSKLH